MDSEAEEEESSIKTKNVVDFIPEMERDWLQFEIANRLNEPSAEILMKRWYRQKFRFFVNKWLSDRWMIPPKPLGSEDYIFSLYPDIEKEWKDKRTFLQSVEPSTALLLQSWRNNRKIHFQNRWLKKNRKTQTDDQDIKDKELDKEIASFCHLRKNFEFWFFRFHNIAFIEFLFFLCGVLFVKYHT